MFEKRYFSAYKDFRTGFFSKLALIAAITLLAIFIFVKVVSLIVGEESSGLMRDLYNFSQTTVPNSILAFSIILFGVGVIFYFFYCQFAKLAKIADEIESEEDSCEPFSDESSKK